MCAATSISTRRMNFSSVFKRGMKGVTSTAPRTPPTTAYVAELDFQYNNGCSLVWDDAERTVCALQGIG